MALKDEMPQVAAWVAEVRAAFCDTPQTLAEFNANIVAGVRDGQASFYASENGRTVGRRDDRPGVQPFIRSKAELEAVEAAQKAKRGRA